MGRPKKVKPVEEEVKTPEVAETPKAPEPEMYNGKKIISSKEVEINGNKHKEIVTEEGSTYLI